MGSMALFHTFVIFASVMVLSRAVPMPMDNVSRIYYALLQQQYGLDHPNDMGHARNLDALGGGNLVRSVGGLNSLEARMAAGHNRFGPVRLSGPRRDLDDKENSQHLGEPQQKKNFDEIDRSGLNTFAKRNFDEIDRSGFAGFIKRQFDEIDASSLEDMKRNQGLPAYNTQRTY